MLPNLAIEPGITGCRKETVTDERLATSYCSGTLKVFATPSMIALMEQTAMDSVQSLLPEGFTTVGTGVNVRHLKPTLPGKQVELHSKLVKAEGSKLVFEVSAFCSGVLIGSGTHTRHIIDAQQFLANLNNA